MWDAIGSALLNLLSTEHALYLVGGVLLGMAVGVFPGLGGIAGLSLLLPFLYGMEATSALALLIGLVAVIPTSDTFTSVLMGIPGSSASQATVLDGFPLAKQGEAARALGAAFAASLAGGLIGATVLTAFILVARPVILSFGTAELFTLTLLGLSMVGVLAGGSLPKGLLTCGLGLLFGALGGAPATGEFRMTFGVNYLTDGVPLVVVGLAMFAVPEIIDLMRQERPIAGSSALGHGWLQGVKDVLRNRWLVLRCAGLGCLIGALPGLGGSVVDWIAYGHVVQTSRDKSGFGKGDIRGVIAPESANNAKEGGGLIPTILFGIPGSGSMAVFLGGLVLIGVEPGIGMVEERLDLTYTIIWSLALANVLGAGLCLLLARPVAQLTTIRYLYLAPFMIMVISFASFQATRHWGDLLALIALGTFAVYMKRFGWPRPAFLIGFVLSDSAETYLYQAVQIYGWSWLSRPGVLIIAAITLVSVYLGARYSPADRERRIQEHAPAVPPPEHRWPMIAFGLLVAALFGLGATDALGQSFLGRIFPLSISAIMLVLAVLVVWKLIRGQEHEPAIHDAEEEPRRLAHAPDLSAEHYLLWLVGILLVSALVGFFLGIGLFFLVFLTLKARSGPLGTLLMTASALGFLALMSHLLTLDFPWGLLQDAVQLPWPLN